jgi:arylsulfatase
MYRPQDMPLPVWREGEVEDWPQAYQTKYFATSGGHEAVGMCNLQNQDWQRIKAYYYAMISLIDRNVGRLLQTLGELGCLEDTVIVFTTDHGENLGDHHLLFKGTTYDCVTAVPFIVSWPGESQPGVAHALCSSIDIMPTLLDLVDVPYPQPDPMQGTSLYPALSDPTYEIRDSLLIENGGVRRSVRTEDALLTWHGRHSKGELYDLSADPDCLFNLWDTAAAAERQEDLLRLLLQLMAENVDPLPVREGPW